MKHKYGPTARLLTEDQVEFLQLYLKTKGVTWCAKQIGVAHPTLKQMIMRWESEHGTIEYVEPRSIPKEPRRLFKKESEQKRNSCRRWTKIINNSPMHYRAISGRRIA